MFDVHQALTNEHKSNGKFEEVADLLNWFQTLANNHGISVSDAEIYVTQYAQAWVTAYRGNMGFIQKLQGRQSALTRSQLKGVLNCARFDRNGSIHLQPKRDGKVPAQPAPSSTDWGRSLYPLGNWSPIPQTYAPATQFFQKTGRTGKITTGMSHNGYDLFFNEAKTGKWADHIFVSYRPTEVGEDITKVDVFHLPKFGMQRPGENLKIRSGVDSGAIVAINSISNNIAATAYSAPAPAPAPEPEPLVEVLKPVEEEPAKPAVTPLVDTVRHEAPTPEPAAANAGGMSPAEMRAAIAARKNASRA